LLPQAVDTAAKRFLNFRTAGAKLGKRDTHESCLLCVSQYFHFFESLKSLKSKPPAQPEVLSAIVKVVEKKQISHFHR
jgi:hypothetical protein